MRQLNYHIALDKHRYFGRAAESCHVSQPALSNALRELDRELGITIIKRSRTFQGITPEGERVILWARQMLASLEGLRSERYVLVAGEQASLPRQLGGSSRAAVVSAQSGHAKPSDAR